MLGKPDTGWTEVKIGSFTDRASNLTDVPFQCLKAFIHSYETNLPATISFDAEGWEYIVVVDHYSTHIISDNCDMGFLYESIDIGRDELLEELINDIEMYFDGWVDWEGDDVIDDGFREKREKKLTKYIKILEIAKRNKEVIYARCKPIRRPICR